MFKSLGFRNKIMFGIAGVVVLLGLAVIIFAKTVLYENLLQKLEKRGNLFVLIESRRNIGEVNEFYINPVILPDDKEQSSGITLR